MYNVKQKTTSIIIHNAEVNKLELEFSMGFIIPALRFKAYGHVAGGRTLKLERTQIDGETAGWQ
jgi:hypothetical protein